MGLGGGWGEKDWFSFEGVINIIGGKTLTNKKIICVLKIKLFLIIIILTLKMFNNIVKNIN